MRAPIGSGPSCKGIWFALDGLRKVLHLVLLLVLFGLLLAASQSELPFVPDRAALVIAPRRATRRGALRRPARTRCRAGAARSTAETRLRDLVDVIDPRATTSASRRSCSTSTAWRLRGLPMLQDLAPSIRWFRESGKKVYAYAESYRPAPVLPRRRRPTRSTSTRWATS